MTKKEFYVEYWDGDDDGTYSETVTIDAAGIVEGLEYAENKYGSVIQIKEVGIIYGDKN